MSYILDALKKSESERQRQNAPGFADVPAQVRRRSTPLWIWLLGGLLLINAAVLSAVLLRGAFDRAADAVVTPVAQTVAPLASPAVTATQMRDATEPRESADTPDKRSPPPVRTPVRSATAPTDSPRRPATLSASPPSSTGAGLPTLLELTANGTLQLPELHLDVHVYSDSPQDRFVFVNMSKYREAARLADGPLVKEIVADGVILEFEGNTFLLPRE